MKLIGYNLEGIVFIYYNFVDLEFVLDNFCWFFMVSDVLDSELSIILGYGGLVVIDENGIILFIICLNVCLYNYVLFMGICIKEGRNFNGFD